MRAARPRRSAVPSFYRRAYRSHSTGECCPLRPGPLPARLRPPARGSWATCGCVRGCTTTQGTARRCSPFRPCCPQPHCPSPLDRARRPAAARAVASSGSGRCQTGPTAGCCRRCAAWPCTCCARKGCRCAWALTRSCCWRDMRAFSKVKPLPHLIFGYRSHITSPK